MKNIELSGPLSATTMREAHEVCKGIFYYRLHVWAWCVCVCVVLC